MSRNELYAMDASPDELHLFGQFCASLRGNKIGSNVFLLLDAVNLKGVCYQTIINAGWVRRHFSQSYRLPFHVIVHPFLVVLAV